MSYEELIKQTALNDERYIVMTAENRAVLRSLPAVLKDRFIDTGITEQTMIGAAAGLALRGRIPIVHALATFLTLRAFEFIRTDVGIGNLPVKLSSWVPGFLSDGNGPTHQAIEDISIMRGIPGMQIFAPADEQDLVQALPAIWASPHPSYVRLCNRKSTFNHQQPFEIGKAEVIAKGEDITLITYGFMLEQSLLAKDILEKEGKSVGLINLRSLKPVDEKVLIEASQTGGLLVTIEDHFLIGGLYSILAEVLLKNKLTAEVLPLALNERWFRPGTLAEVLEYERFTGAHIAKRVLEKVFVAENA